MLHEYKLKFRWDRFIQGHIIYIFMQPSTSKYMTTGIIFICQTSLGELVVTLARLRLDPAKPQPVHSSAQFLGLKGSQFSPLLSITLLHAWLEQMKILKIWSWQGTCNPYH